MLSLSAAELKTLAVVADRDCCDGMPRIHLEKLYRLDLIEPAACGPALSRRGQEVLHRSR